MKLLYVLFQFDFKIFNSLPIYSWGSLLMVLTAVVCAAIATVDLLHGQADAVRLQLPLGLSMGLRMDALAAFMALTACTVSAVIVVYSFGYMKKSLN